MYNFHYIKGFGTHNPKGMQEQNLAFRKPYHQAAVFMRTPPKRDKGQGIHY